MDEQSNKQKDIKIKWQSMHIGKINVCKDVPEELNRRKASMAIKDSCKREALKALGPNNNIIFHLFTETLQGYGPPSYAGHFGQRRWSINGYGRAAPAPAAGGKVVSVYVLSGGAVMKLA